MKKTRKEVEQTRTKPTNRTMTFDKMYRIIAKSMAENFYKSIPGEYTKLDVLVLAGFIKQDLIKRHNNEFSEIDRKEF